MPRTSKTIKTKPEPKVEPKPTKSKVKTKPEPKPKVEEQPTGQPLIKSYYIKDFTYKGKSYKFANPLRVRIENFLCSDYKTLAGEMYIPDTFCGYTQHCPFDESKVEKEIITYIKSIWEDVVLKDDAELEDCDVCLKKTWLNLLKVKKEKNSL